RRDHPVLRRALPVDRAVRRARRIGRAVRCIHPQGGADGAPSTFRPDTWPDRETASLLRSRLHQAHATLATFCIAFPLTLHRPAGHLPNLAARPYASWARHPFATPLPTAAPRRCGRKSLRPDECVRAG